MYYTLQLLISKETSHFFFVDRIHLLLVDRIQSDYLYIELVAIIRVTKEIPNHRVFSIRLQRCHFLYTSRTNFNRFN